MPLDRRRRRVQLGAPIARSPREVPAVTAATQRELRSLARRIPVASSRGAFVIDEHGYVLSFDKGMELLLGWSADEVVGRHKNFGFYGDPDELGVRPFELRPLFQGSVPWVDRPERTRMVLTRKDGVLVAVEARLVPGVGRRRCLAVEVQQVVARFGEPSGAVDADEVDPDTALPTRAYLDRRLRAAVERARESGEPIGLLVADLDYLEALGRRLGGEGARSVLREVAGLLRASVRESDVLARLEEARLAIALEAVSRGDVRRIGARLRRRVEQTLLRPPGAPPVQLTLSIGAACFPADGTGAPELMTRAEIALEEALRLGRNRVWCYVRRPRVVASLPVWYDGPAATILGRTRNLSTSGLFVSTLDDLPPGLRLAFSLALPGEDRPMPMVGRVARRADPERREPPGVGIEFERLEEDARRKLQELVHRVLVQG
ncbi:MAG: diguanylate cyclase [Acidobacteria bacterium]|nr:MAG: diguanylate cyclase [Acidobacteriota bacterium]